MGTFIHPFTDFGFKKLFGEEASAPLLVDILNQILPDNHQIESLVFLPTENLPRTAEERRAVFDLHCQGKEGGNFIVEMQRARMAYFKDRSVYYATFPISRQAQVGDWNYKLEPVFCVAFLDFKIPRAKGEKKYGCVTEACLTKKNGRVFWDKLQFIQVELPRFNKTLDQLETRADKWFYFLKNLASMDEAPALFRNDPVFEQAFREARLAAMTPVENHIYQDSLKVYRDWFAVMETAKEDGLKDGLKEGLKKGLEEGRQEGLEEGLKKGAELARAETIRQLQSREFSNAEIAEILGLTAQEVERLMTRLKMES